MRLRSASWLVPVWLFLGVAPSFGQAAELLGRGGSPVAGLASSPLPAGIPLVTRGPYLQLGTSTGIVVRWRTSLPTDSRVRFGASLASLDRSEEVPGSRTEHVVALTGLAPSTRYVYT